LVRETSVSFIKHQTSNIYLDETVAIKELLPTELSYRSDNSKVTPLSPDFDESYAWALDKFLKEAKILWNLGKPTPHPNIVEIKRFHKDHGTAYMIMAYVQGEPFLQFLENHGEFNPEQLQSILMQLLAGLKKAHVCSVLHRDIKPSNILLRPDGSPILIDFGAARRDFANPYKSMLAVYSPMYAALEQVAQSGEQGPWTDTYGIGATFYHIITGKAPTPPLARVNGASHTAAIKWIDKNYPREFLSAIDAAIETSSQNRPQSIPEFRKLLSATECIDSDDKTVVMPIQQPIHKTKPANPKAYIAKQAVAIILIGLILLFWFKFRDLQTPSISDPGSPPAIDRTSLSLEIESISNKMALFQFNVVTRMLVVKFSDGKIHCYFSKVT